ncbi:PleD family two-component system response regulator [Catalinimonas niigatensis]|uniref:response regulator n=1 Tax=Catalinimonas niigatensis TaxID=1397264 RepID=UPI0026662701|nr:response regulator [Catalinimonas niigatensis]WPP50512.1 response regulator [Catalinimonas niigatensis]
MRVLSKSLSRLNLKKFYLTTLLILTLMIVLVQWLNIHMLDTHRENSRLLELAGKQKLLSQQILKLALLTEVKRSNFEPELQQMALLSSEWSQTHFYLKFGNGPQAMDLPDNKRIEDLIFRLQPHKDAISDAVNELLMVAQIKELRLEIIQKIRAQEKPFSLLMGELTTAYQLEAEEKLSLLSMFRSFILVFTMLSLLTLFLLSYQMYFKNHYAYLNHFSGGQKGFFNEHVADEFMISQTSGRWQNIGEDSNPNDSNLQNHIVEQQILRIATQRIRVLVIEDVNLSTDYISWFLNRWEIDFSVVKNAELAITEAQSQTFDLVLMSEQQAFEYQDEYTFSTEGKSVTIPIVSLDTSDVNEIQIQIYHEDTINPDRMPTSPGNLYRKIEKHLSKDKWKV